MEQWDPATMQCGLCMRFSPWTVHLSGFSSSLSHEFLSNSGYSKIFEASIVWISRTIHSLSSASGCLTLGFQLSNKERVLCSLLRHLGILFELHGEFTLSSGPKGQSFNSVLWCFIHVFLALQLYLTTILSAKLVKIMRWSNITSLRHGSQVGRVAKPQHGPFRHN